MNKKTLEQVSERSGLSLEACRNMLDAGWSFVEPISGGCRWESPVASLNS